MTAQALTSNPRVNPSPLGSLTHGSFREPCKKNTKPSRRVDSISAQMLVVIDESFAQEEPIIVRSRARQVHLDTLVSILLKRGVIRQGRRRGSISKPSVARDVAYKVAAKLLDDTLIEFVEVDMTELKFKGKKPSREFAIVVSKTGKQFLEAHGRANHPSVRGARRQAREGVAA